VSAERTGRLRDAYERVSRHDIDGFLTVLHHDVEWTEQVLPDQKVYRGHDGVRRWISDVTQAFTWGTFEMVGMVERGDDAVVEVRVCTTGLASGVAVEASVFHVIRFRDEKIATITALFDRDEALRAAGLG
jgi:ketosteroid isomerase-like protein